MHIVPKVLDQGFSVLGYGICETFLPNMHILLQKEWAVFDGQKPINR